MPFAVSYKSLARPGMRSVEAFTVRFELYTLAVITRRVGCIVHFQFI